MKVNILIDNYVINELNLTSKLKIYCIVHTGNIIHTVICILINQFQEHPSWDRMGNYYIFT
jgi:predicted lipase